ncbi:MAG: DUF1854 domain-containing protein [Clostridia bacterium]|nr:DUF1854 domain-containing protein [Clostridia bacterium]
MQTNAQALSNTHALTLADAIDIGFIDVKQAEFFQTAGGFIGLRYGGKEYPRVSFRRALPVGQPSAYISVADGENKEIGILRDVAALADDQLKIVTAELDRRYYCPLVLEIKSVKDKLGYVYLELRIQGAGSEGQGKIYDRNCAIKDVNKNIRMLDDNRLILFDVDGNRYMVPSLSGLEKKSLKRLEPYLF